MPFSTAKREKLVGPVQLALLGALFAVSFLYLAPSQEDFAIEQLSDDVTNEPIIGELDLAYLKARNSSGQATSIETKRAVVALVYTGQVDIAQDMLQKQPDINLNEKQRYALDLEMATVDYFEAEDDKQKASARLELLNRLELMLKRPQIRTVAFLERGAKVSAQLEELETAISFHLLLAKEQEEKASFWYLECARAEAILKNIGQASACFENAIETANSSEDVFDIRLEQFYRVSEGGNKYKQNALISALSTHHPMSNKQLEELAGAMLANGRSEKAYPMYAYLAKQDKPNQLKWLLEATKWAQASNNPGQAADYLDQAASLSTGQAKADLLERSIELLIAAGKNEEALLRFTTRINKNPRSATLLREGIKLAQQFGRGDQAAKWNLQLVTNNPNDFQAVKTQVELSLADQDLTSAAKWARQAVSLRENAKPERLQLAQILEWSGNPRDAQRQWEWIADNFPDIESIEQVVRLAEMNRDSAVAAIHLEKLLMLSPRDDKKIERLVKLYELEGKPLRAAKLLIDLQSNHGSRAFTQRELARLYQRHVLYPEALTAWNAYAKKYGRTSEETLNRMELLWRLNQPSAASVVAQYLVGTSNASEASKYQIRLISEIAYNYRLPDLAELVQPRLAVLEDESETIVLGKRLVQSLEDAGRDQEAIEQATSLWKTTQSVDIAFTAMNLAYRTGNAEGSQYFLNETEETAELQQSPAYWNLAASIHHKNKDKAAAVSAYKRALELDASNTIALSGLLWTYIDDKNFDAIAAFIDTYAELAEDAAELWSPMGIAYIQLGLAEKSLTWFERQLDRIEADYNMLLTYADALEYAGRAEPARKVRLYTIRKLRPALAQGSAADQQVLLRQYAQLMTRYGSVEDNERVARLMLREAQINPNVEDFWREDLAISWLMATERHEHARTVMAKLHHERLEAPAWQDLALAMAANDLKQINTVLNGTGDVSVGNHILALRQLGDDKGAYIMAKNAALRAPSMSDRNLAKAQYLAMRNERPRFVVGKHRQISMNGFGIKESGFSIRHSFDSMNVGIGVDYVQRTFSGNIDLLSDNVKQDDIAVTLFHGDRSFGGKLTAGYNSNESNALAYAVSRTHVRNLKGTRTLSAELAYNEASSASNALRFAGKQNRATLSFEQALGFREYMKLQADMNDISTRVEEKRVARGLQASVEFGIRGAFGSNAWTTSIAASRSQNTLADEIPEELNLPNGTALNTIITDESTSLSFGASISRGGVRGDYPQASSPRYYLNANLAHTWPKETFGLKLDAGAGIRVLGGDELSIAFTHDSQPASEVGSENDATTVGVNYWYHF